MRDKTTALILSILVGSLGVDRFYLGYIGVGILKLLTGGCFGILWLIDVIHIATGKLGPTNGLQYENVAWDHSVRNENDPYEDLMKIASLRDQGIITEEEFEKLKANCLTKIFEGCV